MRAIVTEERRRSRAKGGSPFGASPFWATALPNFLSVFPIRPENSASRRRKIDWPECSLNKGLVSKGQTLEFWVISQDPTLDAWSLRPLNHRPIFRAWGASVAPVVILKILKIKPQRNPVGHT